MSDKQETIKEVLAALEQAKAQALRNYEANGKQPFDSGRYDGLKAAVQIVEDIQRASN